jgi:hypothetical protein
MQGTRTMPHNQTGAFVVTTVLESQNTEEHVQPKCNENSDPVP